MVSVETVELAEGFLAEGVSQRQTAIRAGLCRGTVSRIKSGRWRQQYRKRMLRMIERDLRTLNGTARKCSQCGAKVEIPCRACQVRRLLAAESLPRNYGGRDGDGRLAVEIRDPEDQRRYEALHRRKQRECSGNAEPVWEPTGNDQRNDEPTAAELAAIEVEEVGSG